MSFVADFNAGIVKKQLKVIGSLADDRIESCSIQQSSYIEMFQFVRKLFTVRRFWLTIVKKIL